MVTLLDKNLIVSSANYYIFVNILQLGKKHRCVEIMSQSINNKVLHVKKSLSVIKNLAIFIKIV